MVEQWSSIRDRVDEQPFHRDLSQRRGLIKVSNDLSAQELQVIDMLANGLSGQAGIYQVFEERSEAGDQSFPGGRSFSHPIQERGQFSRSSQ